MFQGVDPLRSRRSLCAGVPVTGTLLLSAVLSGTLGLLLGAPARGADVALPPDLQRVVEENARSVSQLRSINAVATIAETFEAHGKRAAFRDNVAIWTKGRKVREDWSAVPGTPMEARQVAETLPDGLRIEIGPPDASRHVITPETEFKFRPGDPAIALVAGEPDAPFGKQASLLHEYASVQGRTLARKVREDWARGYRPNVSPVTDDTADSILIRWDYPQVEMMLKVWVDPARGHMIRKLQSYYKDELVTQWTSQIKDYGGGVFWPEQVERTEWKSGRVTRQISVNVKSLEVNPAVDDGLFTLAGIGLPQGAEVQDRVLGLRYRFGAEPKLSEDFVQAVVAPGAGNGRTSASAAPRGAPAASPGTSQRARGDSPNTVPGAPSALVAASVRSPWTWAFVAALAASAGTGGVLLGRRKQRKGPAEA